MQLSNSGILSQYPHTRDEIIAKLMSLHKSGLSINVIIHSYNMIAVIQHRVPDFLAHFKGSEVSKIHIHSLGLTSKYVEIHMNFLQQCSQLVTMQRHLYCSETPCQCRGEM